MKTLNTTLPVGSNDQLRRQRGISLMEMGIAATVLAALILGALLGLQSLQFERRLSDARKEIPLTITAAVNAIATQADTATLTTAARATLTLSAFNVWPSHRVSNPGLPTVVVNGHFPGSTEQMIANTGESNRLRPGGGFAYWIRNVPPEACMPLLQLLVVQGATSQVFVTPAATATVGAVGGTGLITYANGGKTMNTLLAAGACAGNTRKNLVAMIARQ